HAPEELPRRDDTLMPVHEPWTSLISVGGGTALTGCPGCGALPTQPACAGPDRPQACPTRRTKEPLSLKFPNSSARLKPVPPSRRVGTAFSVLQLFAFAQACGLALEPAQIIQLGAAHAAGAHHIDVIDHRRMNRKNALHALPEADLAHGDGFAQAAVLARDHGAFEGLQALFVALSDLHVNANGVARTKLRYFLTLVVVLDLRQ